MVLFDEQILDDMRSDMRILRKHNQEALNITQFCPPSKPIHPGFEFYIFHAKPGGKLPRGKYFKRRKILGQVRIFLDEYGYFFTDPNKMSNDIWEQMRPVGKEIILD